MLGFYYSTDKIIRIMFMIVTVSVTLLVMFINQSQLSTLPAIYPLPPTPSVCSVTQSECVLLIPRLFCWCVSVWETCLLDDVTMIDSQGTCLLVYSVRYTVYSHISLYYVHYPLFGFIMYICTFLLTIFDMHVLLYTVLNSVDIVE